MRDLNTQMPSWCLQRLLYRDHPPLWLTVTRESLQHFLPRVMRCSVPSCSPETWGGGWGEGVSPWDVAVAMVPTAWSAQAPPVGTSLCVTSGSAWQQDCDLRVGSVCAPAPQCTLPCQQHPWGLCPASHRADVPVQTAGAWEPP